MNGLLLIDKPIGWTSHDLVNALRRRTGQRRIGHAGTLDPLATGLMILLLGEATRRGDQFSGLDKEYRGSFRLGLRTDSWDMDGKILSDTVVPEVSADRLKEIFAELTGDRLVAPPVFSAVKQKGQTAYARARRGETVVLEKRPMRVDVFELEAWDRPEVYFRMACSKGTYVRSLGQEVGERLGCGATLSSLVRTRIGDARLGQAHTWKSLREATPDDLRGWLRQEL